MSTALLLVGLALADPTALREPGDFGVSIDDDAISAGAWLHPRYGVWTSWAWPAESLSLGGASRHTGWARGSWALESYLFAGLVMPLRDPGIGLTVGPSAQLRTRGRRLIASIDVSVPMATRLLPGQELAISGLVTPRLGFRAGPIWTTAHIDVGATWTHRLDTRVLLRPGLAISLSSGRQKSR